MGLLDSILNEPGAPGANQSQIEALGLNQPVSANALDPNISLTHTGNASSGNRVLDSIVYGDAAPGPGQNQIEQLNIQGPNPANFYEGATNTATSQTGSNNVDNYRSSYTPQELEAPQANAYTYDPYTVGQGTTYNPVTGQAVTGSAVNSNAANFDVTQGQAFDALAGGYNATTADAVGYNAATGQASGYNAALVGDRANYTPEQIEAAQYEAYMREVQANDLAREQLNRMLAEDSDYIKRARTAGAQYANSRGLLNTSFGAGAAEGAAIDRAAPIAMQDAGVYNQRALADMQYQNQARAQNAQFQNQANIFNAGSVNDARRFAGENARFDAGALNDSYRFNANAQNAMSLANMNALNTQYGFNADAQNRAALTNAGLLSNAAQFGADAQNRANLQNANNRTNVSMQNADWTNRGNLQNADFAQQTSLANQSAQNAMNIQNMAAQNAQNMTNQAAQNAANLYEAQSQQQVNLQDQNAINTAGQVNAAVQGATDQFNATLESVIDRFNETVKQDQVQFEATLEEGARQFDKSDDSAKWQTEFRARHDETMAEINQAFKEKNMDYEVAVNMRSSYVGYMSDITRFYANEINAIEQSDKYETQEDKDAAIANLITMRDYEYDMTDLTFRAQPGWQDAWSAVPDDGETFDNVAGEVGDTNYNEALNDAFKSATGRSADLDGLQWYTDQINSGNLTLDQAIAQIKDSEEARQFNPEVVAATKAGKGA